MSWGMNDRASHQASGAGVAAIVSATGIVFGDIGTSPLYALQACFGTHGVAPTPENVLGVLSLVFWAVMLVVSVKYVTILLRMDNKGEGGILSLLAMIPERLRVAPRSGRFAFFGAVGVLGASLLFGDGVITPAISVLSAVEGLEVVTHRFDHFVVAMTVVMLIGLFMAQRHGTGQLARFFGPITLAWFVAIALVGGKELLAHPEVLVAVDPRYALITLFGNGWHGLAILGGVVLVVTGGEALYADMGHFGRKPIQNAWFFIVLPALLLNYFGQGALLLREPAAVTHLFYGLVGHDAWYFLPMVVLATCAAIIASQGIITSVFSLVHQAIRMGLMPRLVVVHTSDEMAGRIFVPSMNFLLATGTIGLVLIFRDSTKLAAAYGLAVSGTMLATSMLMIRAARERLSARPAKLVGIAGVFFVILDFGFWCANGMKFLEGGYVPIVIGGIAFLVAMVWMRGRSWMQRLFEREYRSLAEFFAGGAFHELHKRKGAMVVMSSSWDGLPPVLGRIADRFGVISENVVLTTVVTRDVPYVEDVDRITVTELGHGWVRVVVFSGFREFPNIPKLLESHEGFSFGKLDPKTTMYVLGKENIVPRSRYRVVRLMELLFGFLHRNAHPATDDFHIPPARAVEVGVQLSAPGRPIE